MLTNKIKKELFKTKEILIGLILVIFAYSLCSIIVEFFYDQTFFGCRPLFRHPLWNLSIAFFSSLSAIFLFVKFRKRYCLSHLLLIFSFFYLIKIFIEWGTVYSFSLGYFIDIFFEIYYRNEMFLFALNFFSFGFLYMKE